MEVAMCAKETKGKGKVEAKVEGPPAFAEMCRQMMPGGMPDCCGPETRGMMGRWMTGPQGEGQERPQRGCC
jgi:hypothetical protein